MIYYTRSNPRAIENFIKELNDKDEDVTHVHMNDQFIIVVTGQPHIVEVDVPPYPEFPALPDAPVINLEQLLWTNQLKTLFAAVGSFFRSLWPW
jgi:hypothetical protein